MVSDALTDHAAVEQAMADFDRLGRELFLLRAGFPETNEAFVVTGNGRYDARALYAAAFEIQHERALMPAQVTRGAAGAFSGLGYVVTSPSDAKDRQRFRTIDEALAQFRMPVENAQIVRDFVAVREYAEFYLPASGAYIGMKPRSGQPAHYVGSGQIVYREVDGRLRAITLPARPLPAVHAPVRAASSRSPRTAPAVRKAPAVRAPERVEQFCPNCFLALPASGVCSNCD